MTPDELILRTRQHVGNRTDGTLTNTWYLDRVNNGYRQLATFQGTVQRPGGQPQFRQLRFYELEDRLTRTLLSSMTTNFVSYSAGVFALLGLYDITNKRPVFRKASRLLLRKDPTEIGTVRIWAPAGEGGVPGYYIHQRPVTSIEVREYVYKYPELLAVAGAAPVIPATWHPAIHMLAGAEAAGLLDMPDKEKELLQAFTVFVATRRTPYEEARTHDGQQYFFIGQRL